jgi:copper homeostasis protein
MEQKIEGNRRKYTIEACVESLPEAIYAEDHQADIIELCSELSQDGLSPSLNLIEKIISRLKLPIKVMVRSRAGNFFYTQKELESMIQYIQDIQSLPIQGIVFGALREDYSLDIDGISLIAQYSELPITIHKCIDLTRQPLDEINKLKSIPQVHSILTSGCSTSAMEGIPMIKQMITACEDRLNLIVAGKVTPLNLEFLHAKIGANHYHGRRIV